MSTVDEEVKLTQADADAIKTQGAADLEASNKMYDDIITKNEAAEDEALGLIDKNKTEQERIANEQTDFAIEKIEQEREWAKKDYTKEQSGAYADWQKQSNQYGVNAEQKASMGMAGTGYSESSQVSMYNQYQNRIAVARESYLRADAEFVNAMKDARLQNNAALAQIAAETLKQKLEITLTYAQQNNTLLQNKANAAAQIKAQTHSNYMDILGAIYQQEALEETQRHNKEVEGLARDQFDWQVEQAAKEKETPKIETRSNTGSSIASRSRARSDAAVSAKLGKEKETNVVAQVFNQAKRDGAVNPDSLPINMKSVVDAFGGAISARTLLEKIEKGEAKFVIKDGERHVVRTVPLPTSRFK